MIQVFCDDPENTSLNLVKGLTSMKTCRLWPRWDNKVPYVRVFISSNFNFVNKKEAQLQELADVTIQFNRLN